MTYLQRVTKSLISRVKTALEKENITDIEAEHVAGLLIQIFIYSEQFQLQEKYVKTALNVIRRESGVYTKLDLLEKQNANKKR